MNRILDYQKSIVFGKKNNMTIFTGDFNTKLKLSLEEF